MKNNPKHTKFYIVRHGQTQWNIEKRLQGQKDSPLTKSALESAQSLAHVFKKINFSEVFSSDLLRSQKTAEIIAAQHNLLVKTNRLIRERSFGQYEGTSVTEFRDIFKDLITQREALNYKQQYSFKLAKEIESDEEIVTRLITFLRETALAYPGENIAIVAHGGIMRALLVHLGFATYKEMPHGSIDNLGYSVVESDGIEFFIKETHGIKKLPHKM